MYRITAIIFGLFVSLGAQATILDLGRVTRDTVTGLDWLDLQETYGLSPTELQAQFEPGGVLEGYRYASRDEIYTLWSNILGVSLDYDFSLPASGPEYSAFIWGAQLLGNNAGHFSGEIDYGVGGIVQPSSDNYSVLSVAHLIGDPYFQALGYSASVRPETSFSDAMTYVVRPTGVAAPSTLAVLSLGLVLISQFRRRLA